MVIFISRLLLEKWHFPTESWELLPKKIQWKIDFSPHIKKKIVAWTILVSRHQMTFYFVLCIIITRNRNLIMVSKSVGHQFQTKLKTSVGFTVTIFLNHATTTIVIITTQILKILRLLKLKNWISNVWLTWLLTRLLIGNSIFDFSIFYLTNWKFDRISSIFKKVQSC